VVIRGNSIKFWENIDRMKWIWLLINYIC
jgi:hypothetical protein